MKRLAVLTLVTSLGLATPVFAADSVLATATRLTRDAVRRDAPVKVAPAASAARARASRGSGAERQDQTTGLIQTGMGKGKKIFIGVAIAAAVTGVIYAIDHGVDDNTPSSQGLR
jgi:hypothetical protein